jgi:glycosyltransferase involved in cell wall biosynthesis
VGRVEPVAKGHDLLLEVAKAEKWRARPVYFEIYGEGASFNTFERAVERYNLQGHVRLNGHVKDSREIWSKCHALLLPSRYEGLPLVVTEAMLSARPVVTTAISGCEECVEEAVTGFLAESPCAVALDRALEACWQKRTKLEAMGAQARSAALSRVLPDPAGALASQLQLLI